MSTDPNIKRQYFEMLMESQFWSPEQLRDYQRKQLAQLLRHAKAQSPYYAHRLDAVLWPSGHVDWDRWGEIPILKRDELLAHYDELTAREIPHGHGPVGETTTSGTTGQPLRVKSTAISAMASEATRWRADAWHSIDWSQTLFIRHGENPQAVPPFGFAGGAWGPPWDTRAALGKSYRLNRKVPPDQLLTYISRVGATYAAILGPKSAHMLAVEAQRTGISLPIRAFFVSGEAPDEADRSICRDVFGAELIDLYSCKEGRHIAYRCPTSGKWHVNAENLFIEILDENDQPCAPGQQGRVVITPFFSTAQPLIRYELGDLAVQGAERCACGRCLPVVDEILGRVSQMFRHPDGRAISRFFPESYRLTLDCTSWQFAQVGPREFEVRYVPKDWQRVGDEGQIARAFREWYFDDAQIKFQRLRAIPPAASGKFMEYVNETALSS